MDYNAFLGYPFYGLDPIDPFKMQQSLTQVPELGCEEYQSIDDDDFPVSFKIARELIKSPSSDSSDVSTDSSDTVASTVVDKKEKRKHKCWSRAEDNTLKDLVNTYSQGDKKTLSVQDWRKIALKVSSVANFKISIKHVKARYNRLKELRFVKGPFTTEEDAFLRRILGFYKGLPVDSSVWEGISLNQMRHRSASELEQYAMANKLI